MRLIRALHQQQNVNAPAPKCQRERALLFLKFFGKFKRACLISKYLNKYFERGVIGSY